MKGYKGAIADNIYRFNWLVYAGCPHQDAVNHYCSFYKVPPWQSDSNYADANFFGLTHLKSYALWFRTNRPSSDVIVHETFHAMVMLAEKLDISITSHNEEVFSYYQQMMYREIKKILR